MFRSTVHSSKHSLHSWNAEEIGSTSELIGLGVSARTFTAKQEGKMGNTIHLYLFFTLFGPVSLCAPTMSSQHVVSLPFGVQMFCSINTSQESTFSGRFLKTFFCLFFWSEIIYSIWEDIIVSSTDYGLATIHNGFVRWFTRDRPICCFCV